MTQLTTNTDDAHQLNEWRNRQGDLLGAVLFLTPAEIRELQQTGAVMIELDEKS